LWTAKCWHPERPESGRAATRANSAGPRPLAAFLSFLAFYPEPVTTVLRQRTVTPTWQRYAVVAGAAGPRREPGSDNFNPRSGRIPRNPLPSWNKSTWPRRWSVLVFPGRSLGLGHGCRYFEGRKGSDGKGSTGNTRGHGRPGDRRSGRRPRCRCACPRWTTVNHLVSFRDNIFDLEV
jgi:hypothetical protein